MKKLPFYLFYTILISTSIIFVILIMVLPINLINIEQAERIAEWKSEYVKILYSFDLVKLHEGSIINNKELSDEDIIERIKPYLNLENDLCEKISNYKYKKMNGIRIKPDNQFLFDKFYRQKSGNLISFKRNKSLINDKNSPIFYMFIDINGKEKPNRIGQDIFIISIFENHIEPLGEGRNNFQVKQSCSPIGNGYYCSEYYLLGGQF